MTGRPADLPDYANPPLDEVVLGVQFDPVAGYASVMAKDVWSLFAEEFPHVHELHALPPQFEVFGREGSRSGPGIKFDSAPLRGRLWFVSSDDNHLVQFQDDRLLLNWRRRPNGVEYPRFEGTSAAFAEYIRRLDRLFVETLDTSLNVNQAEVTYINIIPLEEFEQASNWVRLVDLNGIDVEGMGLTFSEVLRDSGRKPFARLHHELSTAFKIDSKQKVLRLSLTCRGRPLEPGIEGILNFLTKARGHIVRRFSEIATDHAEEIWEKIS